VHVTGPLRVSRRFAVPNSESFDLEFRPRYWWGHYGLETHYRSRIKGELRRQSAPGDFKNGFGSAELLEPSLSEKVRHQLGAIHPWLMGGEYLPDFLPTEIEIARVVLKSVTMDVISVRARRTKTRIRYRIVDEYPEYEADYPLEPATSRLPLTMAKVVKLIETGDLLNARQFNLQDDARSPEDYYNFCTVSSDVYPELAKWFDEGNEEWLAVQYDLILQDFGEEDFGDLVTRIQRARPLAIARRVLSDARRAAPRSG